MFVWVKMTGYNGRFQKKKHYGSNAILIEKMKARKSITS